MTNDEAIKIIEDAAWWYYKKGCTGLTQAEIFEARDMAIEALETATVHITNSGTMNIDMR